VRAQRAVGHQVIELHALGGGVPDLLVVWPGGFCLQEVKNPEGRDREEESQAGFRLTYRGPRGTLVQVRTVAESLAATGISVA
jgi:hypothetical protein